MKLVKRILGISLALVVAAVSNPMSVNAKEAVQKMQIVEADVVADEVVTYEGLNNFEKSQYMRGNSITTAILKVTPRSNDILIEMSTTCSFTATRIGVREIYVQEKVWYGWKTIAQAADYTTGSNFYSGTAYCTNAVKGKTYRVLCTHYAVEGNATEHVVANQSEEFVYN